MEPINNTQRQFEEESEINLKELASILLKRAWIIILSGLGCALIAFFISEYVIAPTYVSTTKVYVMNKGDNSSITYTDLQTGSQLTQDYMTLVTSRPVIETVIADLNLDISNKQFVDSISVTNKANTRILSITVRYTDPILAQKIADAVRESAAVQIKKVMKIEEVTIVEEANIPEGSASPNTLMNILIGGILGGMVSVGFVLLFYYLDDTIKNPDDISRHLGISILTTVPIQKDLVEKTKKPTKVVKQKK